MAAAAKEKASNKAVGPTAASYKHFEDQRDHVLAKPNMYIGTIDHTPREEHIMVFNEEGVPNIMESLITIPLGLERLYLEVISNAGDNVDRSRRAGVDVGTIEISMNNSTITVRNGGLPIPIEKHPDYKNKSGNNIWVPELLFGHLLSSSNYDPNVERTGAGTNGIGNKAVNIFSTSFSVNIGNGQMRKQYQQSWSDHMKQSSDPVISPYKGKSYVEVTYTVDFPRFGYPEPNAETGEGGYTPEIVGLFARHAADMSVNNKCVVTFNGMMFDYQDISKYAELYFGHRTQTAVVHYEWPAGVEVNRAGKPKNSHAVATVEMCVLDTPDDGKCISFVNGLITREGGVHVTAGLKAMSVSILEKINSGGVGKKKKAEKEGTQRKKLTLIDVRPHISLVLIYRVANPNIIGQTKDRLTSPEPKIIFTEKEFKKIEKWDLMERLTKQLEAKEFRELSKTDGKQKRFVDIEKADHANFAGHKTLSKNCTLYIVEGKSAKQYATQLISLIPSGRDYNGVYPMKGKPLNVMNANIDQLLKNVEFNELKEMLGLKEGANYLNDHDFNTLRYGQVVVLADADTDGYHILGLILNFFHTRFSSLLARGFVMYLRTPILRLTKGSSVKKFYTQHEYDKWVEEIGIDAAKNWDHKYCKGLGSSEPVEVEDDFKLLRKVVCVYDDSAPDMFRLAFDDKLADARKEWIANHKRILEIDEFLMQPISQLQQPISQFLFYQLVDYSIDNVSRSIPRLMDGLKESQRKIIWGALTEWGHKRGHYQWNNGVMTGNIKKMKVAQFAPRVAHFGYAHGEKSLSEAIIGMAQEFVGKNNLPYFTRGGMFGSRFDSGEDHASERYIWTSPDWWLPLIFRNEDMPLLTPVVDDGAEQEPVTFIPILPTVLFNGATGIGSGSSTFVANYNIPDICNWYIAKINDEPLPEIIPWYRDFTGGIRVEERKAKKAKDDETVIEDDPLDPDEVAENAEDGILPEVTVIGADGKQVVPKRYSMITTGVFREQGNKVIIEELPVGRNQHKYTNWLQKQAQEKKITDYRTLCGPNTVYFEVTGLKNPSISNLRLQKSYGLSNMVLLDINDKPSKYQTVDDILEAFYTQRLPYYDARRLNIISSLQFQIDNLTDKMRFIQAVINQDILIINPETKRPKKKAEIIAQMRPLNIPDAVYDEVKLRELSEDDVNNLQERIDKLVAERTHFENTPAAQLWLADIQEFLKAYNRHYKDGNEVRMMSPAIEPRLKSPSRTQINGKTYTIRDANRGNARGAARPVAGGRGSRGRGRGARASKAE